MSKRSNIRGEEPLADVLAELAVPETRWGKPIIASEPRVLAALGQAVALGDARAVPYLVWLLKVESSVVRLAAVRTIDRLMPRDVAGLVLLETTIRDRGFYADGPWCLDDRRIPEPQARLLIEEGLPVGVLGLLSLNADGRTRELATRALATQSVGEEVPLLLLRANDWVPKVSDCARRALLRRCEARWAASFAAALPLVERLAVQRRADHSELVEAVGKVLTETEEGIGALAGCLANAKDREIRRAVARLLRSRAHVRLSSFEPMFRDSDPVVRTNLAAAALQRGTGDDLVRWIVAFFSDSLPRIRVLAFESAEKAAPEVLEARLIDFLFDENVWLREFARQKLAHQSKADFARSYSSVIRDGGSRSLRAALAGLAEVGSAEDAAVALPHVGCGSSRIRQVALRTVCALQKDQAATTAAVALASDCVGLSKVATELIAARKVHVFAGDLAPLASSEHGHVRANALTALASVDRWEALIAGLLRASDPDPRVVRATRQILARWDRVPPDLYTRPNEEQRRRIASALKTAPANLADVKRTLDTILGSA